MERCTHFSVVSTEEAVSRGLSIREVPSPETDELRGPEFLGFLRVGAVEPATQALGISPNADRRRQAISGISALP